VPFALSLHAVAAVGLVLFVAATVPSFRKT